MDGWLDEREERAWRSYLGAHAELRARMERQLQRDSQLSSADYEILVNLSESDDGRMRAFELGAATKWEKSRLSHHLTRMERRGLVSREDCETDARGAFIVLTSHGRAAIETAAPLHAAEVRRSFVEALTPQQLDALREITDALRHGLIDEPE
ncbi:MAG TPA: MarR family winged helix-turn-helix transcriptional regulator [Ilumatobacteraceae bacterium]